MQLVKVKVKHHCSRQLQAWRALWKGGCTSSKKSARAWVSQTEEDSAKTEEDTGLKDQRVLLLKALALGSL